MEVTEVELLISRYPLPIVCTVRGTNSENGRPGVRAAHVAARTSSCLWRSPAISLTSLSLSLPVSVGEHCVCVNCVGTRGRYRDVLRMARVRLASVRLPLCRRSQVQGERGAPHRARPGEENSHEACGEKGRRL